MKTSTNGSGEPGSTKRTGMSACPPWRTRVTDVRPPPAALLDQLPQHEREDPAVHVLSSMQKGTRFLVGERQLSELREERVQALTGHSPGCEDLDAQRRALGVVIDDHQTVVHLDRFDAFLSVRTPKVQVCRKHPAVQKRNLQHSLVHQTATGCPCSINCRSTNGRIPPCT